MRKTLSIIFLIILIAAIQSCEKDPLVVSDSFVDDPYGPTRYHLKVPAKFPDFVQFSDYPLTVEGIELGKRLFFDPILSKNNNTSCASCHRQEYGFSDRERFSEGTHGGKTSMHSMPIANLAWMPELFWNGRASSPQNQAFQPVVNPVEMDMDWEDVVQRLEEHPEYPTLFENAFGDVGIDSSLVAEAITQFELTIVSSNSKFDRVLRGEATFTELENDGRLYVFNTEDGDCFHCHGGVLGTDNLFHNNGLDSDGDLQPGRFDVTGVEEDFGRFKTPTLRNLAFTAPYMHDGRFNTLSEVIDFYSEGVQKNRTIDALMKQADHGGVQLSAYEKESLIAFLLTLSDSTLITNEAFRPPLPPGR